jgi:hypothetical protein
VSVARTHGQFIQTVEEVLQGKTNPIGPAERDKVLRRVSWPARVDDILSRLER